MTIAAQAAMMRFMHPGYMAKNSGQDVQEKILRCLKKIEDSRCFLLLVFSIHL